MGKRKGRLRIGTSSWKYDSWEGLVYERGSPKSYLEQYAGRYDTVEIDQWFWSLFESPQPRLPEPAQVEEYSRCVPLEFRFTVKVPNSITLTHHYSKGRSGPLKANPGFLSLELYDELLRRIEALRDRLGALIFQFEYLNRQKMPSQAAFLERLAEFFRKRPGSEPCVIELRNPRWLDAPYFDLLAELGLGHCFLQGYYMPDITETFAAWGERLRVPAPVLVRLHGPDRQGMEARSGGRWDRIVTARDAELERIAGMIDRLLGQGFEVYLNVNNHYEGSAPLTIEKLRGLLGRSGGAG
jgi:uncharacterized protein YecE (DUF72 family)